MSPAPSRFLFLSLPSQAVAFAQSPQPTPKDTSASVAGRVTIGGKPAAGISVVASSTTSFIETQNRGQHHDRRRRQLSTQGSAAADFQDLARRKITLRRTRFQNRQVGQSVNVAEGEAITKVDFVLVRGAVVTGRITDAEGNPIIGESVSVMRKDVPADLQPR